MLCFQLSQLIPYETVGKRINGLNCCNSNWNWKCPKKLFFPLFFLKKQKVCLSIVMQTALGKHYVLIKDVSPFNTMVFPADYMQHAFPQNHFLARPCICSAKMGDYDSGITLIFSHFGIGIRIKSLRNAGICISSWTGFNHGQLLRYDLIDSDHMAFMFNVGTFPDLSIPPIDTNICMRHLRHNI